MNTFNITHKYIAQDGLATVYCLHFTGLFTHSLTLCSLFYKLSHTSTVVRECFKGDEASQWKRPKFDPSPHQNPLTDLHKNWQA